MNAVVERNWKTGAGLAFARPVTAVIFRVYAIVRQFFCRIFLIFQSILVYF